jgi:hypothetical protein
MDQRNGEKLRFILGINFIFTIQQVARIGFNWRWFSVPATAFIDKQPR